MSSPNQVGNVALNWGTRIIINTAQIKMSPAMQTIIIIEKNCQMAKYILFNWTLSGARDNLINSMIK